MKRGQSLEIEILKITKKGKGIGIYNDKRIEVAHTIPGQIVKVEVVKNRKSKTTARLVHVVKKSSKQISPKCKHFGQPPDETGRGCGGCSWQMLVYRDQLLLKKELVEQALKNILSFDIDSIIPSPTPFHYRNKMEWSFGDKEFLSKERYLEFRQSKRPLPNGFFLGFHPPGSYSSVIDLEECFLVSNEMLTVFNEVKLLSKKLGGLPYSTYTQSGFWRYLVIRESFYQNDLMVHLCTTEESSIDMDILCRDLLSLDLGSKNLVSIQHSINNGLGQTIGKFEPKLLHGQSSIQESLLGLTFNVSAHSFFQANTLGAELLYKYIIDICNLSGNEIVYDLFCGTGTIGILLAKHGAKKVYGIEEVESAVNDAKCNALLNQIDNCAFICGKVEKEIHKLIEYEPPDIIILDPPRSGLHPKTILFLRELKVNRIVYVSCNPYALAEDLSKLLPNMYEINQICLVDLFPQTPHIETVVELILKN